MSVIHTLGTGTDAATPWLRGAMLATGAPILCLFVIRILPREGPAPRPKAKPDAEPKAARAPAPSGRTAEAS
jgi:hypothetical protein